MNEFIHTTQGYINLAAVVRMKIVRDTLQVWYREGDSIETAFTYNTHTLEEHSGPTVVALPGYYVVSVNAEAPHDIWKSPVIAWRLIDGSAHPICADTLPDSWGVLDPTGAVTVPCVCWYGSLESFRNGVIEDRAAANKWAQQFAASKALPPPPTVPASPAGTLE